MASGSDIIREFLVGIGFKVDTSSESRMKESIGSMTKKVVEMGAAIEATALAWVAAISKMAAKAEDLYWASSRLGSSIQSINQFTYAISQMGGSSGAARQSLEALAAFMRTSPGAGGVLVGLGIDPRALKDTVSLTTQLSKRFAEFAQQGQYYRAKAYASFMGIDELTLQSMIRDAGRFGTEYQSMVKAIGLNQQQAGEDATFFMQRLRALGTAIDLIWQKAASGLYRGLGQDMERLRGFILQNSDAIVAAIQYASRIILVLAEVLVRWAGRGIEIFRDLYSWFERLPPNMQRLIEYTAAIAVGWRVLSGILSASPIGIVLRLAGAFIALYDDYRTWKEGGQSLIDWAKWEPAIQSAERAIDWIIGQLDQLTKGLGGWQMAAAAFAVYIGGTWAMSVIAAFMGIPAALASGIGGALSGITGLLTSTLGAVGTFVSAFLSRMLPITAFLYEMRPSSTQTDAQEQATPGFSGRFSGGGAQGAPFDAGAASHVPDALVGSLAHAQTPDFKGYGGFMSRLPMMMGIGSAASSGPMKGVVDFFKSKGWSAAQAAGIAANLYQESKLNPSAEGDGGQAYGIGQWHPDRQLAFQRLFGKDIRGSSIGEQLAFYDWELHNTEAKAGTQLGAAQTPEQAAIAVEGSERPAGWSANDPGPQGAIRAGIGRQIYDATANPAPLSGGPGVAGGGAGDSNSVALNQTNNITVSTDQPGVVRSIMNTMNRQNSDLLRNAQGAVR